MTKKSTLILAALSLLAVGSARADKKLVATDSSTGKDLATVALSDISKVNFSDGSVVFNAMSGVKTYIPLTNSLVLKFVEDSTTGISQVGGTSGDIKVGYDGYSLSASGLKTATNASVYTIGGQKALSLNAWTGDPVSTASLANGVYILKVNNKSIKFVKK